MSGELPRYFTAYRESLESLGAVVGAERAGDLLGARIDALGNPLEVLFLKTKLRILTEYLQRGDRVSAQEIDRLATESVVRTIHAITQGIQKELGLA